MPTTGKASFFHGCIVFHFAVKVTFQISFEQKLLEAHEEQNSEAFTEAVKEFDSVSRLDQWLTTMLLRIKKTIQGDAGDLK